MTIGCHGLVWSGTFDAVGLERSVASTQAAGFQLIELPLLDPFGFDLDAAKRVRQRHDVEFSGSLGLSDATDISSDDRDVVAAGEKVLNRALEILAELGSQHLVGVLYGVLKKYPGPATDAGRRNSQDVLRRLSERASELGVQISLEVVNRYESNLFNTCAGALAYLDELGDDRVKVHLDTYHMNIEESDMVAPVLAAATRLGYVHIGESHRGYLGSGTVDFDSFFRALASAHYTGPIVFESFSTAVVDDVLATSLAIWRNLWKNSEDLANHANTYIRNKIHAVETIALH